MRTVYFYPDHAADTDDDDQIIVDGIDGSEPVSDTSQEQEAIIPEEYSQVL